MPLAEFETLYWQAVSTLPSIAKTEPLFSCVRVLFNLLCWPTTFNHQLVNLIVFSAAQRGLTLCDTTTFDWCRTQLQQTLSPDDLFVVNGSTEIMPLTVLGLKLTFIAQLARRLLF